MTLTDLYQEVKPRMPAILYKMSSIAAADQYLSIFLIGQYIATEQEYAYRIMKRTRV